MRRIDIKRRSMTPTQPAHKRRTSTCVVCGLVQKSIGVIQHTAKEPEYIDAHLQYVLVE